MPQRVGGERCVWPSVSHIHPVESKVVTHISVSLSLPELAVQKVLTVSLVIQIHSPFPGTLSRTFFPTCSQNIIERSECARLTFSPVATGGTAAWKSAPGFKCFVPINQRLTVFQWGFVYFRVILGCLTQPLSVCSCTFSGASRD